MIPIDAYSLVLIDLRNPVKDLHHSEHNKKNSWTLFFAQKTVWCQTPKDDFKRSWEFKRNQKLPHQQYGNFYIFWSILKFGTKPFWPEESLGILGCNLWLPTKTVLLCQCLLFLPSVSLHNRGNYQLLLCMKPYCCLNNNYMVF